MKRKKLFSGFNARLLRALALALALTLIFTVGFQIYIYHSVNRQGEKGLNKYLDEIRERIEKHDWTFGQTNVRGSLQFWLTCYDFYAYMPGKEDPVIGTNIFTDCSYASVVLDGQGSVRASNQLFLLLYLRSLDPSAQTGDPETDQEYPKLVPYYCIPEELHLEDADQFVKDYLREDKKMRKSADIEDKYGAYVELYTVYLNRETQTFIPHTGKMYCGDIGGFLSVDVDADLPGYSLEEFHPLEMLNGDVEPNPDYVYGFTADFYGESRKVMEKLEAIKPYTYGSPVAENQISYQRLEGGLGLFDGVTQVNLEGEPCWLNVRVQLNYKTAAMIRYFRTCTLLFAAVATVLALLWCLWRYRREKALTEEVRRSLTDTLAHDVKTPLMAISGYTENVLNGKLSEAEEKEYLHSILDNVAYTDELISRTLYLNHMEKGGKAKPETVRLAPLTQKLLDKYELMLHEKRIRAERSGSAELQADPTAVETILENLISNAVKYTPDGGKIEIKMDEKGLTVTNSVAERLDVKRLKEPFVRGDAARSNRKGSGLGLAIADRAAKANGFKLQLSCTETDFRAELKF